MNRLSILFISLLATACKPTTANVSQTMLAPAASMVGVTTPAVTLTTDDAAKANASDAGEVVDADQVEVIQAQDQAIEAHEKEQLNLPDNKRSRWGYLGDGGALVEKSTNMRMRLEKKEIEKNGNSSIIVELKIIDENKIYGFNLKKFGACKTYSFQIKKSNKNWVEFMDICLNKEDSKNNYSWMIYDRKNHVLTELYSMRGEIEYQSMIGKDPEVESYKNGLYAIYYPHLKDVMYFEPDGPNPTCHWKSGETEVENTEKACEVSNTRDLIEDGGTEKP